MIEMKILHILDHSLPLHSGYTFRSQNIFRAQKNMGFDPVILTSPKHEESLKKNDSDMETIAGFKYYRTGFTAPSAFPMATEVSLMYRLYKKICQVVRIEKPDIIHAHSPVLNGIPAILCARKFNIPIVYEIRAFWEDAAVDHGTYSQDSWKYNLTRFLETQVCKMSDHVCILCNGLKRDLISRGLPKNKMTPIFNGINPNDLKPTDPDEEYLRKWQLEGKMVIGFAGSFYRYEGLDLLIKAFSKIADRYPETMLLLVGGGEMEDELKGAVKENKLHDRVVMPGRVPHERISGVYAMIDILAYPRYSMRLTDLVTPLKPLEAMAMGKALVASDVGGHRELIQNGRTGVLFHAGSHEELSKALKGLIENRDKRQKLEKQGFEWVVAHHTWDETTSVYRQVYKTCV